jgi:hypothetical protein
MTAIIKQSAPSYSNWLSVLGSDRVEVLVPESQINYARPGRPQKYIDGGNYYQIDVRSLSPVQRQRLVQYLSKLWKQPSLIIEEWISDSRNGIPLIASDVVVAMGLFR